MTDTSSPETTDSAATDTGETKLGSSAAREALTWPISTDRWYIFLLSGIFGREEEFTDPRRAVKWLKLALATWAILYFSVEVIRNYYSDQVLPWHCRVLEDDEYRKCVDDPKLDADKLHKLAIGLDNSVKELETALGINTKDNSQKKIRLQRKLLLLPQES